MVGVRVGWFKGVRAWKLVFRFCWGFLSCIEYLSIGYIFLGECVEVGVEEEGFGLGVCG